MNNLHFSYIHFLFLQYHLISEAYFKYSGCKQEFFFKISILKLLGISNRKDRGLLCPVLRKQDSLSKYSPKTLILAEYFVDFLCLF